MGISNQIAVTPTIKKIALEIDGNGLTFIENALLYIKEAIVSKSYSEDVVDEERKIRWSRTADQIVNDGYVYQTKGCSDLVILFQALCEARGYPTNFLRVKDKNNRPNHSMTEVQIDGDWYTVDAGGSLEIKKGGLKEGEIFKQYTLWKKGRDGWDVGLKPN